MSAPFHYIQAALVAAALALIGKRRLVPDTECLRLITRRMAEAA